MIFLHVFDGFFANYHSTYEQVQSILVGSLSKWIYLLTLCHTCCRWILHAPRIRHEQEPPAFLPMPRNDSGCRFVRPLVDCALYEKHWSRTSLETRSSVFSIKCFYRNLMDRTKPVDVDLVALPSWNKVSGLQITDRKQAMNNGNFPRKTIFFGMPIVINQLWGYVINDQPIIKCACTNNDILFIVVRNHLLLFCKYTANYLIKCRTKWM